MNKILASLLVVLTGFAAQAQNFRPQNFLNVLSLNVSNTLSVTNLASFPGMTNILGVTWTNNAGTKQTVTTAGDTTQVFKDAGLWVDREGRAFAPLAAITVGQNGTNSYLSPATLYLQLVGGSGANAAVTFVFQPLWDGVTPPQATTQDWSVALTATTSTKVSLATNVPMYLWPGAKSLRLKSIVNGDTDASSQVTVSAIQLNGFIP